MRLAGGTASRHTTAGVGDSAWARSFDLVADRLGPGRHTGTRLGALLFEHDLGFFRSQLFFAEGAGYVAERRGRRQHGAELPQWALSLRVGVGGSGAADERALLRHIMLLGVADVFRHLDGLRLAGDRGSGLSEGGGGTENE
jgi:hypothetical protein